MPRRDEEKKRRRLKRLHKHRQAERSFDHSDDLPEFKSVFRLLNKLKQLTLIPEPSQWPGAVDPTLARPDAAKLAYAEWASSTEPGKSKLKGLEEGIRKGPLGFLPDMDHWAIEEFFWHGVPGDAWHPLDAYLASAGSHLPPPAQAQLRLWKEARLSLYEIGEIRDDLLELREWDPFDRCAFGPWKRSIALNIGGVNFDREHRGQFCLTYLSPWARDPEIYCAMGYGSTGPEPNIMPMLPLLGLRHPEIVSRPLPWKLNKYSEAQHVRAWQSRDWHGWLRARLHFPFTALAPEPTTRRLNLTTVMSLLPSTAQQARDFGIYFEVLMDDGERCTIGATALTPLDVTSPNLPALHEYSEYRHRVGIPPGVRANPTRFRFV
jgi:hypothetical protein